jgi:hypothetical protein
MGLENPNVIDVAGLERDGSAIVLTIADGLDWADEHGHLAALQRKLDAYLACIETGQVFELYPQAAGRRVVIDVVTSQQLPSSGLQLLGLASTVARALGASVTHQVIPVAPATRDA